MLARTMLVHTIIAGTHHGNLASRIVRDALATGNACISLQVVQECLNTILRKAEIVPDANSARSYLDTVLAPLIQVAASAAVSPGAGCAVSVSIQLLRLADRRRSARCGLQGACSPKIFSTASA
jgi:hypothetical protein